MSISRQNWSALSMLAQQWTIEDEVETERERRRKTKSSVSDVDRDISSDDTEPQNISETSAPEDGSSGDGGLEQLQMDFVEMLRMRDERRRRRHVETLSRQKQEETGGGEGRGEEDNAGEVQVEVLGDTENDDIRMDAQRCSEAFVSSPTVSSTGLTHSPVSLRDKQIENESTKAVTTSTPTESLQTFVSSVSISFNKNDQVTKTKVTSPLSTMSTSSQEHQNGSACSFEPTDKPAFTRQSSRTMSFRMLKKKEEDSMPLERSVSMRIKAKKFEQNQKSNEEEEQKSPFQRNSRQRLSSGSIQEKMERLAHASQKWEAVKPATLSHKTLFLVDEVSRKRELFEKEQTTSESNLSPNKQDYRTLSAGISDRINRWVQGKTLQNLSSLTPTDLRHVDISSKKMLFERGQEDPTAHK